MKGTYTKLCCLLVFILSWMPIQENWAQTISTVAGSTTGTAGYAGDGGPATAALLWSPTGVVVTPAGYIYITDNTNNMIRRVAPDGIISQFAGTGTPVWFGDNGPATAAGITYPYNVAVDAAGNVYIADYSNNRIRKVDVGGTITTIAGTGFPVSDGDDGPAVDAAISGPYGIAVDGSGNIYFSEHNGYRIRKIDNAGTITTVIGNGVPGTSPDGTPAAFAKLNKPAGIALDASGAILVADMLNHVVMKIVDGGTISTVAGNLSNGYDVDNVAATTAMLNGPTGVAVDVKGNIYIADKDNHRIRKVDLGGIISTVAGGGTGGDGGTAVAASLSSPNGVFVDNDGNIFSWLKTVPTGSGK